MSAAVPGGHANRALLSVAGSAALAALVAVGCSAGVRSAFRPTDPTFTPRPGPVPRVYLYAADVPPVRLRSVGLIEVTVPAKSGISDAMEAAAAKGQEVGCWALIEHTAFAHMKAHGSLGGHVRVGIILVHGSGPSSQEQSRGKEAAPDEPDETTRFDCVIQSQPAVTAEILR